MAGDASRRDHAVSWDRHSVFSRGDENNQIGKWLE